jgi:hypothetical protein
MLLVARRGAASPGKGRGGPVGLREQGRKDRYDKSWTGDGHKGGRRYKMAGMNQFLAQPALVDGILSLERRRQMLAGGFGRH